VARFINHDGCLSPMIDKKSFEAMRKHMEAYDALREQVIAHGRIALKSSKAAIYAAHRGDMADADKLLAEAKTEIAKLDKLVKKETRLMETGTYGDALEEYAEAALYVHYLKTKTVATPTQLGVEPEVYLGSVSDLVGELVRKAVNSTIAGDYKTPLEIKTVVEQLYAELMLFDWRNTPLRKKFDAIKYGLEKLEDLALKIKLKQ